MADVRIPLGADAENEPLVKHIICVALATVSISLAQGTMYVDNLRHFDKICLQASNRSWGPEHNDLISSLVETLIEKGKHVYGLPLLDSCPWPLPSNVLFLNLQIISNGEALRVDLHGRLETVVDAERSAILAWPIIWMSNSLHPLAIRSDVAGPEIEELSGFLLEAFSRDFHLSRR